MDPATLQPEGETLVELTAKHQVAAVGVSDLLRDFRFFEFQIVLKTFNRDFVLTNKLYCINYMWIRSHCDTRLTV